MTTGWTLDLCYQWRRIGFADAFTFQGATKLNEPGAWTAEVNPEAVTWGQFTFGSPDVQSYQSRHVDTVRLVRPDGTIAFGGYVAPVDSGNGGLEVVASGNESTTRWSGPDLWDVLKRRIVYPNPATEAPWASAYDTRTGVASSVAAAYINANAGVTALTARKITGLTVTDQVVGPSGSWSGRLQPLSQLVARICHDSEIVCRFSVDYAGAVTALLTAPMDLSQFFVFSDQQDLASKEGRRIPASVTFTIAGGQGTGDARTFWAVDAGPTGIDRREEFYDQSSLTTGSELQAAAEVNTALGATRWSVSAEVAESLAALELFGSVVNEGDWLTIEYENERVPLQITGAQFDITPERQVTRPILGVAEPDALKGLLRDVGNLAGRFDRDVT